MSGEEGISTYVFLWLQQKNVIYICTYMYLALTLGGASQKSAGLAGVSSEMGLDDGLLVCILLLLI